MLFTETTLSASNKAALDHEGHVLLPRRLTPEAQAQLITALADIEAQTKGNSVAPRHYAAEHNAFLASLIAHPEMLALAQAAIGPELRFDHCVALNRAGGDRGVSWHSHDYAEERPELGFVRIFFYVNGFHQSDGGLKAVPGSHLFRDPKLSAHSDDALREGWLAGKIHPRDRQAAPARESHALVRGLRLPQPRSAPLARPLDHPRVREKSPARSDLAHAGAVVRKARLETLTELPSGSLALAKA